MPIKPLVIALTGSILLSTLVSGCVGVTNTSPADTGDPMASQQPEFFFYPEGSASRNLPIFQNVLEANGAGTAAFDLTATVSELVDTGFNIDSIVHTATKTKTGQPAESVSLAISFDGKCLIGQFSDTWLTATVEDATESGCLIGDVEKASQLSN
jgi:hypothetical protein